MVRRLVFPVVLAFAMVVGFSSAAQAECEYDKVVCEVVNTVECAEPEQCPLCFEDTYVLGIGPISLCMFS